ncbi:MAG: hypothetical protein NWE93_10255 [Candidatus Bathyarchaeota archaeon]|nr:hypothetical protein [Candidatus Bathyarchaeota archaeon]
MSLNIKKIMAGIWYLALIIVVVDALLEWGYPHSDYYPGPWQPITQLLALLLVLATGIPIMLYLWKKTPSRKLFFALLASTLIMVTVLTPHAMASVERRARAQWYIDDLKSQGLNIVDAGSNHYRHGGGATRIENYSDVTPTAKAINCSRIQVRCGTPTSFLFFMGDGLQLVFWADPPDGVYQYGGEYLYYAPYDSSRGIILLPEELDPIPTLR